MLTPAYALTATERVLPRMALDFTTGVLDPRVTVARLLDTATRVNSSGLIEIVNANLPRFDYDPVTLAAKGLLIEESRANKLLQSNFAASWSSTGSPTVTLNAAVSPDGTTNATQITSSPGGVFRAVFQDVATTAAAHTFSIYLKSATGTNQTMRIWADTSPSISATVTVTSEWQRFTVSGTTNTTARVQIGVDGSANAFDVYAYGAQLETGAFATSYIPTTTTSLTRNADVVSMTGTNFSDWYNQAAGAFAVSFDRIAAMSASFSGGQPRTLRVTNTGATDFFILGGNSSFGEQLIGRASGVDTVSIQTGVQITANTVATECFGYAVNNFALSVNGASAQTDVSGANPATMDVLHIGDGVTATRNINGHVRKISYWPQRITNAEVQAFSKG
jgi:hypothetical protein